MNDKLYKRIGNELVEDINEPSLIDFKNITGAASPYDRYQKQLEAYNSRPRYPINTSDLERFKEGESVGERDFMIRDCCLNSCDGFKCKSGKVHKMVFAINKSNDKELIEFASELSLNAAFKIADNDMSKEDCSQHKKEVAGISDMKVLAEMIGDLHYETFAELLHQLDLKVTNDSIRDRANNKTDLSCALWDAAIELNGAATFIKKAWQISKPFMNPKK